jgi:isochorismate hydrolase
MPELELINPALLVIDMQKYFVSPEGRAHFPDARSIIGNVNTLIGTFRNAGKPLFFTRHGQKRGQSAGLMQSWWKGRLIYEDEEQADLAPEINLEQSDKVIKKQHYDAFRETPLAEILTDGGIKELVICGVMTDLCVETTARQAFMNGFQPVVIRDATASKTAELHMAALKTLAHGFAYVVETERITELIR